MRLLANENVSDTVVRTLRQRGHDVLSAKESMRSQPDEKLLGLVQKIVNGDERFAAWATPRPRSLVV